MKLVIWSTENIFFSGATKYGLTNQAFQLSCPKPSHERKHNYYQVVEIPSLTKVKFTHAHHRSGHTATITRVSGQVSP